MAEEEVIILEEESGKPSDENETAQGGAEESAQKKQRKKVVLLLAGIGGALLLLLIALIVILATKKTPSKETVDADHLAQKIKSAEKIKPLATPSQLEQMIQKANILYARGNKKEALNLFEQIATFSASISNYNLGVAQMRQERYEEAIGSFKKAIQNGENRCISAINAAACALHLKDKKRFEYYLQMAEAYLPDSYNSSLYSYLYALVNYYKGNYFEILSAVAHPTAKSYNKELGHLGAIGYAVFDRPLKAIDLMERGATPQDYLILGQMYAHIGDYPLAVQYLKRAVEESDLPLKSRKALALVELKNQMPRHTADLLSELKNDFKGKGLDIYPVKTKLSPAVYDIHAAQRRYSANAILVPPNAFRLLFEFAPFKVFNAAQTINYIKKGNASIYVDEEKEATKYLSRSSSISHVNLLISKAIKAAIDHHLREANAILQKALERYPNHSILHYNLGLTYAQIGNFSKAHEHFLRSYHLDSGNYLSAIFALMCEKLTGRPIPQVEQFVSDDLAQFTQPDTLQRFYRALFYFYRGNLSAASKWEGVKHDNRPIYLLLDILVNANQGRWEEAQKGAGKLRDRMRRDVLANLLYLHIRDRELDVKRFSVNAQRYLKEHPLDLDAVYYGSAFTRENYIALRFITGTLYPFKKRLERKLLEEMKDPAGIVESLALCDIYLKSYEEAYVLFNQLVDKYNHEDSRTLFLAAVASVGAGHTASASALLELAKLTDPNNLESRYALGLLYLEQKNYEAAIIQFGKIPNGTFQSEYFDFDIVSGR
ncbi:tetratricopeptide repeat protein [Hydrogenimonas cancrithermarum]|uniref:Membrane protein n=1 Tax=Hydrogenimonas cancrithermarum TaxID=2993563 RepID=A0ABN6WZ33_9BACT|nr:tetratricopeptide repeat protein [Hydrogenimonas cancrithermarum]BDY13477.1 membrane protein [Hydrogenimonas cancrithermarum]